MSKKFKAQFVINRVHTSLRTADDNFEYMSLTVRDETSGTVIMEIDASLAQMMLAITGMTVEGNGTFYGSDAIGKKHVARTIHIPATSKGELAAWFETDDWREWEADGWWVYDSDRTFNTHCRVGGGLYRLTLHRYEEAEA